jgi:hypothetical protein
MGPNDSVEAKTLERGFLDGKMDCEKVGNGEDALTKVMEKLPAAKS